MQKNKENIVPPQTPRLQWELLSMKYVQEIFKELTDEVTKYLRVVTPKVIENEEQRIVKSKKNYEQGTDINFIVTDEAGDFIGTCGFLDLKTPTPEIGLWLKESARGKGYGKEMVAALINRLEAHKKIEYIIYTAHKDNIGTRKIAEHFGAVLQLNEEGNEKLFIHEKFDHSEKYQAVEYRIYKK